MFTLSVEWSVDYNMDGGSPLVLSDRIPKYCGDSNALLTRSLFGLKIRR
jgi:hypothetical protein